ncbi:MAG: hypothetical protein HWE22_18925 [Flavobacteriales bacterium]|nr:hypothetical protein [Flavobacteriales bacterium]
MHYPYLSVIVLFIINSYSFSQIFEGTYIAEEDYSNFKSSKLYVVTELLDEDYDEQMRESLEKYWTFSEYTFIDSVLFRTMSYNTDVKSYFLVPSPSVIYLSGSEDGFRLKSMSIHLKIIKGSPTMYEYILKNGKDPALRGGIHQNRGGIANVFYRFGSMRNSSSINLEKLGLTQKYIDSLMNQSESQAHPNSESFPEELMIPIFIKNLQLQCNTIKPGKFFNGANRSKKIENGSPQIHQGPIYILDTDLNPIIASIEDIKSKYKGDVEVVSKERYNELIESGSDINIFFSFDNNGYNYGTIFNVKTGDLIFFLRTPVHKKSPTGLVPSHLRKWESSRKRSKSKK